ncbi:polysaccharide export outer membrane protein [Flavobacterium swingsii]|jgi:polysaccharide export outer membrane protein|uniref:Polysaccharide export outer membrane protein n=1 Tax=Flavobacterium swingsii TaxID=498292 RepID=A0A1I0Z5S0_9FLAO|nr:polysaccharide biosynthesis/export family protein [Flavobacterium swingsii]SFB20944.1 polysaccharide export outer membrane protein [Flavobacterium swingsii]
MKKRNLISYFLLGLNLLLLTSCGDKKQIAYYQNINQVAAQETANNFESKIQPDDLLMIVVSTPDPEASAPFNLEAISVPTAIGQTTQAQKQQQLYLVDANGVIQFPVLGEIKTGGQTKSEVINVIKSKLKKYINDAIVNMRIVNFKVTVQGEVVKPGSFTIASERITLPEALSLAGDLTIYGKRDNIILVREVNNKKTFNRIDITKADFINSPYYYLSQNDLLYVEPNKAKSNTSTGFTQNGPIWIAIASLISSVVLSIFIINKN